jgi:3-oxoacyl-ACP reductase-like protein
MSVFRNIMSRIFRGSTLAPAAAATAASGAAAAQAGAPPADPSSAAQTAAVPQPASPGVPPAAAAPAEPVDVEAVLKDMASKNPQKLNWQSSIVDLMKLLDLDSSLAARKELAQELGYTGTLDGSAEMNTWLHRQVMRKLAENGGRVPESLKG